jgi:CDGSH-type Zn-finger protein
MTDPTIASKTPFGIDVEDGKSYYWCSCGKSQKQPFCDGSHKGSDFVPTKYDATATAKVWFCGCKHSANAPLCDGAHKKL